MASRTEKSKGGYDYEFVHPPPKDLECPVCLLTLRDPHVISCCGNEFCHACIERVQRDGKPCPLCNEPRFTTFLHKKLVREVNALVVRCPQKELGCDWEGELGQLQSHLNPGAGAVSSKGCGFVLVECAYQCGAQLERRLLHEHEMEICPKRPIEMQVASLMQKFESITVELKTVSTENQQLKQVLEKVQKIHKEEMNQMKEELNQIKEKNDHLQKANQGMQKECDELKQGQKVIQVSMKDDLEKKCASLEKVQQIHKEEMNQIKEELNQINKKNDHLQKASQDMQKECNELKQGQKAIQMSMKDDLEKKCASLEKVQKIHKEEMNQLKEELNQIKKKNDHLQKANQNSMQKVCDELKKGQKATQMSMKDDLEKKCTSLQTHMMPLPVPPFYFSLQNFNHYQKNSILYSSEPFYSHPGGYKLCVDVNQNGSNGMFMGVYVGILRGEFDDRLHWPFDGKITIQAYNRTTNQWSNEQAIVLNKERCGLQIVERCTFVLANGSRGSSDFLTLSKVIRDYVKGTNIVRFRVTKVEIFC